MGEARDRLVKIDQPETDIKSSYAAFVSDEQQSRSGQSKKNVKNIVRGCSAREAFVGRNKKP